MQNFASASLLLLVVLIGFTACWAAPMDVDLLTAQQPQNASSPAVTFSNGGVQAAKCYDANLARFINDGLYQYPSNMGQMTAYVLQQIKTYGYSGYWLVHAVR
jgi:hypothetical protein